MHINSESFDFRSEQPLMLEETKWIFRAPAKENIEDPRLSIGRGKKPITIRTNLIVHQRPASDTPFDEFFASTIAELMQSLHGIEDVQRAQIDFQDGNTGNIAIISFTPFEGARLCQFHAYRQDGHIVTSLTLTIDGGTLTEATKQECIDSLSSYSPNTSRT